MRRETRYTFELAELVLEDVQEPIIWQAESKDNLEYFWTTAFESPEELHVLALELIDWLTSRGMQTRISPEIRPTKENVLRLSISLLPKDQAQLKEFIIENTSFRLSRQLG